MSRRRVAGRRQPWLQERLEHAAFRFGLGVMALLGQRRSVAFAVWMARRFGPRIGAARHAEKNLKRFQPALSDAERREVVRDVLETFTRTMLGYRRLDRLVAKAPEFRVEGLEHLLAAQEAAGGRLVIASAHYGNWEAVRAVAALHGAGPAIIYRAPNNRLVNAIGLAHLTSTGWPAFAKGRDGARGLFRHVRDGGAAMILADHRLGGAPLLDFLGAPAETSLAAAQMAATLGAPLLPACAWRVRGENGFVEEYVVRFEPPAPPGSPLAMTQYVNDRIAEWVAADPGQWLWLHKRWRVRDMHGRARKFEDESDDAAEVAAGDQMP